MISLPEALPELPISPYTNYVTARGLVKLQARLDDAKSRLAELAVDVVFERNYLARHIASMRRRRAGLALQNRGRRRSRSRASIA